MAFPREAITLVQSPCKGCGERALACPVPVRNMPLSALSVRRLPLNGSTQARYARIWMKCSSGCLGCATFDEMEDSPMHYTPGRVYRHKTRAAQCYMARARRVDALLTALCVLPCIAFLAMFVKWWLV